MQAHGQTLCGTAPPTQSHLKSERTMKNTLVTFIIAATAAVAAPAFASGYGPSPHYNPMFGAPASERGQSTQTITAENAAANQADARSFGAVQDTRTASGSRAQSGSDQAFYNHP
jgi:hypothetical protein